MKSRIEIRRGRTGFYRFVVIAKNNEIIATSETYTRKSNCVKGLLALYDALADYENIGLVDKTLKKGRKR